MFFPLSYNRFSLSFKAFWPLWNICWSFLYSVSQLWFKISHLALQDDSIFSILSSYYFKPIITDYCLYFYIIFKLSSYFSIFYSNYWLDFVRDQICCLKSNIFPSVNSLYYSNSIYFLLRASFVFLCSFSSEFLMCIIALILIS